jgi:hypothetical protein
MMNAIKDSKAPEPFGPWATALDAQPGVRLSTFWQRRMAMLPILNGSAMAMSRGTRAWLVVLTIAVLATPLVYFSRDRLVAASDSKGGSGASPEKPVAEFLPALSPNEEKIRLILTDVFELSFKELPLNDVVKQLQDKVGKYGVETQLDQTALEDAGIGADTPITFEVNTYNDVSLGSALRLMLRQHNIAFVVRDDVLLLTTKDEADGWLVTRIYPVGDISDQQGFSDLVDAITSTVASATWDDYGGNGTIAPLTGASSLIISQSQDVHDQVLQLLRSLRTARRASGSAGKSASTVMSGGGGVATPRKGKRANGAQAPGGRGGAGGGGTGGGMF